MKTIRGLQNQRHRNRLSLVDFKSDTEFADDCFYNRFDTLDFSNEVQELGFKLKDKQHFQLSQNYILNVFQSTKVNKSTGPDNICGQLLKSCAIEMSSIFHYIFNKSLQTQHVPKVWKDSVVVPVPKSSCPKILNDFRPVALTSIIMKIFEKLVRSEIIRKTENLLDPMQFAYRPHRGVARLLFADFSSAFNTIQPHILASRLLEQFNQNFNLVG